MALPFAAVSCIARSAKSVSRSGWSSMNCRCHLRAPYRSSPRRSRSQCRRQTGGGDRAGEAAVARHDELAVPAGGGHPQLHLDLRVAAWHQCRRDPAEGRQVGKRRTRSATSRSTPLCACGGANCRCRRRVPPRPAGNGANFPASTRFASVIVVCGSANDARLSHEAAAAGVTCHATHIRKTAHRVTRRQRIVLLLGARTRPRAATGGIYASGAIARLRCRST